MRKSFERQLQDLKEMSLQMGSLVEEHMTLAIECFLKQDMQLAEKVINFDKNVNELEITIEERCLNLIALQQPLASDLRIISSIIKINTDMERIGDHAVNIANEVKKMKHEKLEEPFRDIILMIELVKEMIRECLKSFENDNSELAIKVAEMDDKVDEMYDQISSDLLKMIKEEKLTMEQVTHISFICRYLERIGDHTTNICEAIVYMLEGRRVSY